MKLRSIIKEISEYDPSKVELVSVDAIDAYRIQSKSNKGNYYYSILDTLIDNGAEGIEPIYLEYYIQDEEIKLVDGHTRLDAAIEAGLDKIKVVVHVTAYSQSFRGKTYSPPVIPDPNALIKGFTGWASPSKFGIK